VPESECAGAEGWAVVFGVSGDELSAEPALRWGAVVLAAIADRPRLEAERLLAAVLAVDRTRLLAHPEMGLRPAQVQVYLDAVRRRARGDPLPYILGRAEFFGLELVVTPDVLIPRPETELLVEHALEDLTTRTLADSRPAVVDVGTGSGCIAIALAVTFAALHVTALDIDAGALSVARNNAVRHGVEDRVRCVRGDLLRPVAGPIDLILSNPPYIAEGEWAHLPASVRREPRLALLAGSEGLATVRRLLDQASSRLAPGGLLLVEIGSEQGDAVRALARTAFPDAAVEIVPDLAGLTRLLEVRIP
jgi:release factor glutamine methyltransferase